MAWRDSYLDVVLIPLAVLFPVVYHLWLWRAVRRSPLSSTVGISTAARRLWVFSMMKVILWCTISAVGISAAAWTISASLSSQSSSHLIIFPCSTMVCVDVQNNEKQAILVVQSVRNVLMGSTLVATTSILFCTGVAAVLSSTYAVKKPLSDAVFGAHGEYMMALKYIVLLTIFLLAFLCHSLAICTLNQASFLVNALSPSPALHNLPLVTRDYVADVMERGFLLNLAGNRLFFAGAPLLLWIFGPVLPCICSMAMIPILYNIDMIEYVKEGGEANAKVEMVDTESDQSTEV
jgi:uncharacterized membrane protein